jgi:hypothetical protein
MVTCSCGRRPVAEYVALCPALAAQGAPERSAPWKHRASVTAGRSVNGDLDRVHREVELCARDVPVELRMVRETVGDVGQAVSHDVGLLLRTTEGLGRAADPG